jgi:hypothetical protein
MKTMILRNLSHLPQAFTAALLAAFFFGNANAHADVVFNVNSTLDQIDSNVGDGVCHTAAGTCTLRAAVMQANHLTAPGLATINVPAGIYLLTLSQNGGGGYSEANSELKLTEPLAAGQRIVVRGAGAAQTIIDSSGQFKVFTIETSRAATLTDITIRNGGGVAGGGIFNAGDLRLTQAVIENGEADRGGGIYNRGTLDMKASTVRGNRGVTEGGGIIAEGPTRIVDSTISGNSSGTGGAILSVSSALTVVSSTISANTALGDGGGIYNAGTTYMYNSSIIDNDADDDHDELGGIGGGVYSVAGTRFLVVNSIIAGNAVVAYVNPDNCNGNLEVYGWNLFDEVVGCTFSGNGGAAWGPISLDMFGPLQDNGGPTKTHALLPDSRAIDTTDNALGCVDDTGVTLATDQRGAPRIAGARCDVGAFEYGAAVPVDDGIFLDGFESGPVR